VKSNVRESQSIEHLEGQLAEPRLSVSTVKPTRCTIFSSLLNITLHVSDGLSVHHQESKTVHTASGICHTGSLTAS